MENKIEPIELNEFVKSAIEQIENGADISKRNFEGAIEFEVSINKTKKFGGGIKVYVASGEGMSEKEQIAKIKFSIYPNYPERDIESFNFPVEDYS